MSSADFLKFRKVRTFKVHDFIHLEIIDYVGSIVLFWQKLMSRFGIAVTASIFCSLRNPVSAIHFSIYEELEK